MAGRTGETAESTTRELDLIDNDDLW